VVTHEIDGSRRLTQIASQQQVRDLVTAADRRIILPGLFNLRDLGGYPTANGAIPWRRLLRSDALHQLDAPGIRTLADLGLRTIIDLRTEMEAAAAPSPLDQLAAAAAHVSILGGDLESLPLELDAIYRFIVEQRGEAIVAAVGPLCADDAYPALVHCSAGKDRTGIVIALVLSVLGVPDELIAADYALSASHLDLHRTAAIGQLQASTGLGENLTDELLGSPPDLILAVLDQVRSEYGTADGYLLAHGLTSPDLTALRAALAG
jgi:protein-tyrosine phosphatase